MTTLFEKIIAGDIPSDIVYQDELVTAFRDINPAAPTHILIVPNSVIPTVNDLTEADERVAGRNDDRGGQARGRRRYCRRWLPANRQLSIVMEVRKSTTCTCTSSAAVRWVQ